MMRYKLGLTEAAVFAIFSASVIRNFSLYLLDTRPASGDLAANGILIQMAKSFQLLHGNYSRIGFFHPGPAFLQIQATGELLLHDFLKVVPSAASSHMIAALILNCILLWFLLKLVAGFLSRFYAAAFVILYVSILLTLNPHAITGISMAFLYIIPFALFVYSLSILIENGFKNLLDKISFYFSSCLLIHGHASFIGLVGIGFILAVLMGFVRSSFRASYFKELGKSLFNPVWVLIVPSLFALPILINTIIRFPGEIPKYFRYTQATGHNALLDSAQFSLLFFPEELLGAFFYLFIISVLFVSDKWSQYSFFKEGALIFRLSLYVFLITWVLSFFYAFRGIDVLADWNVYTIFWTSGGYALAVSLFLIGIMGMLDFKDLFESFWTKIRTPIRLHQGMMKFIFTLSIFLLAFLLMPSADADRSQAVGDMDAHILETIEPSSSEVLAIDYLRNNNEVLQWPVIVGMLSDLIRRDVNVCTTWHHIAASYYICSETEKADVQLVPVEACNGQCAWMNEAYGLIYPGTLQD